MYSGTEKQGWVDQYFFSDIPHKKWKVKQAEDQHPGGLDHAAWTFILQLLEVQAIGSG